MKRANPELSDQKMKDNAYFNGVAAVKKPTQKQNLPQLINRKASYPRQGSVPVQSKKVFKFYGQQRFKNLENSLLLRNETKYPEASEIASLVSKADHTGETNGIRNSIEKDPMEDPLSFSGAAS